jgi:hypothetical protein
MPRSPGARTAFGAASGNRFRSRERSGPKARGSERSAAFRTQPPSLQRSTAFPNAYQPARRCFPQQPLTLAGILPNSGPCSRLRTNAFRAASGAGRRPAGASGQRRSAHSRPRCNGPRHSPAPISPQDGASRSNRSLWPSFSRTTAPLRGSEPTSSEPRAERAEGPRERAVPTRIKTPQPRRCAPGRFPPALAQGLCLFPQFLSASTAATRAPGATAHSGRRSPERRPPFAAPNQRFQSRERGGPKARGSERSAAFRTQPPSL